MNLALINTKINKLTHIVERLENEKKRTIIFPGNTNISNTNVVPTFEIINGSKSTTISSSVDLTAIDQISSPINVINPQFNWAAKTLGGQSSSVINNAVTVNNNNNIIVTGSYMGNPITVYNGDIDPIPFGNLFNSSTHSGTNSFIIQYHSSGTINWVAKITATINSQGLNITTDSQNNIIVIGNYDASGATFYNSNNTIATSLLGTTVQSGYVVKYDVNGNVIWAIGITGIGNQIFITSVSTDTSGNVIIGGTYSASINPVIIMNADGSITLTLPINPINTGFIIKYNSSGIAQWATQLVSTTGARLSRLTTDTQNNIIATGFYITTSLTILNSNGSTGPILANSGLFDCFVVKYDTNGFSQWATRIAGTNIDSGTGVAIDKQNNIVINGIYASPTVTIYNSNGNPVAILNNTNSISNTTDVFIVKYDPSGFNIWNARIGSTQTSESTGIAIDTNNNVVVTGTYTSSPLIIYNSDGTTGSSLSGVAITSIFIGKYDPSGKNTWATKIGGNLADISTSIAVGKNNDIIVTGQYISNPVIIYNQGNIPASSLSNNGFLAAYIVKYGGQNQILTLPLAKKQLQFKTIFLNTSVGLSTIVNVQNNAMIDSNSNPVQSLVFDAKGQNISLVWFQNVWNIIANEGVQLIYA